jgi:UDP-N-acetylglucosamine diphosphorylase / glucose-1-phosphate thymidylyltransferase / UDP-N-acetylgalactosamine diphosphorylase / glucosamine-1-phosphate N-acetyltransferase / galactosamine-1-phosphate N-acetyltransferase
MSRQRLKAVILAAGRGTRMGSLTKDLPKPMLKVEGKPILEHIIMALEHAGIREIFIVTGYRADIIENYFKDGSAWGVKLTYGKQIVQDGTGKAPEIAKHFVGNAPFLLTCGDILVTPETYPTMIALFEKEKTSHIITVTRGEDVTKGGLFLFDNRFCLTNLLEKPSVDEVKALIFSGQLSPTGPAWYNAAIYLFHPTLFDYTKTLQKSPRGEYEITDALKSMIRDGHTFQGLEIPGRWVDVRDPDVLAQLEKEIVEEASGLETR